VSFHKQNQAVDQLDGQDSNGALNYCHLNDENKKFCKHNTERCIVPHRNFKTFSKATETDFEY